MITNPQEKVLTGTQVKEMLNKHATEFINRFCNGDVKCQSASDICVYMQGIKDELDKPQTNNA